MTVLQTLKDILVGKELDPFNPKTRQHIALVAFLAWVGLGADPLSSSCYGPEAAYLALGEHTHLALYIAMATTVTVFIIALGYNQVITLFPSGGGGYKAATKLISPSAGLVAGAALIVDYTLTIAISIASGVDALFSLLPPHLQSLKLGAEVGVVLLLIAMNLRGVKETIQVLLPIFMAFVISHLLLIGYGVYAHREAVSFLVPDTLADTTELGRHAGWMFVAAVFLRAYSFGAGTYTGIEAVSNNVNMLAEPRVRTGHITMLYIAASLAIMAGGIILLYLLWEVQATPGMTLNAVVFQSIIGNLHWSPGVSHGALIATLASEAGLLLVAANTGFLGGPSVMANLAADMWMPRHFRQLSSRLVIQNGVVIMGVAALIVLVWSRGSVVLLSVLYSINVFVDFSLSLFGLSRYWWGQRRFTREWRASMALAVVGFIVTSFMLAMLLVEKLTKGAWMTVLVTGAVITFCWFVRRHYEEIRRKLKLLDEALTVPMTWDDQAKSSSLDPAAPTAIILVGINYGPGMQTLHWLWKFFPGQYRNFIFVAVGEVDKQAFDGPVALQTLTTAVENVLLYFRSYCVSKGLAAASYSAFGSDPVDELAELVEKIMSEYPNSVCFGAKLVFEQDSFMTRWLHHETAAALQRRLHLSDRQMVILPVKL